MHGKLLALDPGLNHAGLAFFDADMLFYAWTFNPKKQCPDAEGWRNIADLVALKLHAANVPTGCTIAYEMPQFLPGWQKGDQNAILQVAGAAGTIVERLHTWSGHLAAPIAVRPSEWTKGRPKKANHLRMWGRLTFYEQQKLADSFGMNLDVLYACIRSGDEAELEHALDAVCIGLKVLGRFDRQT
jgi:hypothetical protein